MGTSESPDSRPDESDGQDRLDDLDDKIDEGREALDEHEPTEDEPQFIQDGSIRTDLIDDAIRPAS